MRRRREERPVIVMASDGVWDELENEVVVDIVGEALARGHTVR